MEPRIRVRIPGPNQTPESSYINAMDSSGGGIVTFYVKLYALTLLVFLWIDLVWLRDHESETPPVPAHVAHRSREPRNFALRSHTP